MIVILGIFFLLTGTFASRNITIEENELKFEQQAAVADENSTSIIIEQTQDEDGLGKQVSYPCKCSNGMCSCCSGNVLQNFNVNMRQRLCTNLTFDPEDFMIGVKVLFNDRVLYQNRISGKNPPPVCLPIPRFTFIKVCVKFSNVYFVGRNLHACVTLETMWNKETAFSFNFECIRLGTDGVALVKPEEGGGLPTPGQGNNSGDEFEEYDENVATTDKPPRTRK